MTKEIQVKILCFALLTAIIGSSTTISFAYDVWLDGAGLCSNFGDTTPVGNT